VRRSADLQTERAAESTWWRDAVFYQVYIRSFADGNAERNGRSGRRSDPRLGYLELLGVDTIWLTPFYPSPMAAMGYDDVADPRGVDPLFGDLAAFDRLIEEAGAHRIRVGIDLVPNHTSVEHPLVRHGGGGRSGQPAARPVRVSATAVATPVTNRRTTGWPADGGRAGAGLRTVSGTCT